MFGLRDFMESRGQNGAVFSSVIFVGKIETVEIKITEDGERIEVIARDISAELERITVYGQFTVRADGTMLLMPGAETVFNSLSKPNASAEVTLHNGRNLRLFAGEQSNARYWSYGEVIDYLLGMYLPAGCLQIPPIERLCALTGDQVVYDLDVSRLNLVESLNRCCQRIGLKFKFVPRRAQTGPQEAIEFYRIGAGRQAEVNFQKAAERLSISKNDVWQMQRRKFYPVTHRYVGQGDFKVFEATFELVKGWDAGLEETDYDMFSASSNTDFYIVKNVYRKWVLNEAGDYSGPPYNRGDAFDFSAIFETENFVQRRRRFWPAITADKNGKTMGYFLEVSFDGGENFRQYLGAFENRLDECAIWLSSDRLDIDTWIAALKGMLKFRMTASVVSDERLSCVFADGPIDSIRPVVDHIVLMPSRFKYRRVSGKSIFANACDENLGKPDEADDSAALYEYVRGKAQADSQILETIEVQTGYLMADYQVGDCVVNNPESRDIFGLRRDDRSIAVIEQVELDFEKQNTNLKIIRFRKRLI